MFDSPSLNAFPANHFFSDALPVFISKNTYKIYRARSQLPQNTIGLTKIKSCYLKICIQHFYINQTKCNVIGEI